MSREVVEIYDRTKRDCNLGKYIKKPKILPKKSASPSEVIFADYIQGKKLPNIPVSIKTFIDLSSFRVKNPASIKNVEGLKYEVKVYRDIISRIIEGRYSPNFIRFIAYGNCTMSKFLSIFSYFSKSEKKVIKNSINTYYPEIGGVKDNTPLSFLITEKAGGNQQYYEVTTLLDLFKRSLVPKTLILHIMFQVVYSIAVMQKFRLVHNDLHANNVLVVLYKYPVSRYYKIGEKIFHIKTNAVPYIFDWDQSYCSTLGPNPLLESTICKDINICNRFSEKSDLYILFCTLGFHDPISRKYANILSTTKEKQHKIFISAIATDKLKKIPKYIPHKNVYKLSHRELRYVFGKEYYAFFGKGVTSIFLKYNPEDVYGVLYSGFSCRPTSFSTDFPTPLEILMKEFTEFEVKEIPKDASVYRYPGRVSASSPRKIVFVDPKSPSTRTKIVGSPTFRTLKTPKNIITLKRLESEQRLSPAFLSTTQPNLTMKDRQNVLKILHNLIKNYELNFLTWFSYSVKLLDLYLYYGSGKIVEEVLLLVGVSCAIVVIRQLRGDILRLQDVVSESYSYTDFSVEVKRITKFLKKKYNNQLVTASDFFLAYTEKYKNILDQVNPNIVKEGSKILTKKMLSPEYLHYKPSLIAASLVWLLVGRKWNINLETFTGYRPKRMKECADFLSK